MVSKFNAKTRPKRSALRPAEPPNIASTMMSKVVRVIAAAASAGPFGFAERRRAT